MSTRCNAESDRYPCRRLAVGRRRRHLLPWGGRGSRAQRLRPGSLPAVVGQGAAAGQPFLCDGDGRGQVQLRGTAKVRRVGGKSSRPPLISNGVNSVECTRHSSSPRRKLVLSPSALQFGLFLASVWVRPPRRFEIWGSSGGGRRVNLTVISPLHTVLGGDERQVSGAGGQPLENPKGSLDVCSCGVILYELVGVVLLGCFRDEHWNLGSLPLIRR